VGPGPASRCDGGPGARDQIPGVPCSCGRFVLGRADERSGVGSPNNMFRKLLRRASTNDKPNPHETVPSSPSSEVSRDTATLSPGSTVQVVGESHYQESLIAICGPPTAEGYSLECVAELRPEPDNVHDPAAIAVFITGLQVGYLSREDARRFGALVGEAIAERGVATCNGVVLGGWDRGDDDRGGCGVRLQFAPGEENARTRWTQRMKTDPRFRRHKLVHWQWQIDYAQQRGWPAPRHAVGGIEFYGRLHEQWKHERAIADPEGWDRENQAIEAEVAEKMRAYVARQAEVDAQQQEVLKQMRERGPAPPVDSSVGTVDGRRPHEFVEEVNALMRAHRDTEAEQLLLRLLYAIEDESRLSGMGVAPWFYERLAVLYAKRSDHALEVSVLERFARQHHGAGVGPTRLLGRLEKARRRLP
jgi:hypothetical protein